MKKYFDILALIFTVVAVLLFVGCSENIEEQTRIVLSAKNITFHAIGETKTVTARTSNNNDSFVWETSNPAVAVCEGGVITSVGYGVCVVKVTDDGGSTASCVINVKDPNPTLTLNKSEIMLSKPGDVFSLVVKNAEGYVLTDGLSYYSSNRQVMVCENGIVVAKGPGVCKLTVASKNGARTECTVRVDGEDQASVSINENKIHLDSVGDVAVLYHSVPKSEYRDSVDWFTTDETVAVYDDGYIRAVGEGSCAIYASINGGIPSAVFVTVGTPKNANTVPKEKVDFNIGNLGSVMYTLDRDTLEVKSMYMSIGYIITSEMYDSITMHVTVKLNCVKIYDVGEDGETNVIYAGLDLYRENGEYCLSSYKRINDVAVGEKFVIECSDYYVALESGLRRFLTLENQLITKR